jgi:hypothetical protein
MARNRKNQSAAIRFGPALKAFLLCLFIGGAGLGYVWQKNQIFELGQRIKKREVQVEMLKRQNKIRRDWLDFLQSPPELEARVKRLNLGLVRPQPDLVLRLVEPCPERNLNRPRPCVERSNPILAKR